MSRARDRVPDTLPAPSLPPFSGPRVRMRVGGRRVGAPLLRSGGCRARAHTPRPASASNLCIALSNVPWHPSVGPASVPSIRPRPALGHQALVSRRCAPSAPPPRRSPSRGLRRSDDGPLLRARLRSPLGAGAGRAATPLPQGPRGCHATDAAHVAPPCVLVARPLPSSHTCLLAAGRPEYSSVYDGRLSGGNIFPPIFFRRKGGEKESSLIRSGGKIGGKIFPPDKRPSYTEGYSGRPAASQDV